MRLAGFSENFLGSVTMEKMLGSKNRDKLSLRKMLLQGSKEHDSFKYFFTVKGILLLKRIPSVQLSSPLP